MTQTEVELIFWCGTSTKGNLGDEYHQNHYDLKAYKKVLIMKYSQYLEEEII